MPAPLMLQSLLAVAELRGLLPHRTGHRSSRAGFKLLMTELAAEAGVDWAVLEKEYSPGQIRILRRIVKHGLRGVTIVPSPEAGWIDPEIVRRIPTSVITVVVPVSPIKSHPDIDVITETVETAV